MAAFSGTGIGLSLVFGSVFVAFVAEIYYLLWWKKRILINNGRGIENRTAISTEEQPRIEQNHQDVEMQKKSSSFCEESIETELMRLHNLSGPPRILFTIVEETKEDLFDFDDGKSTNNTIDRSKKGSSRTKSLSDFLNESPFYTPISSPLLKPVMDSYNNPLFESTTEAELNRLMSSPPPRFKFLRDAEEKLLRKIFDGAGEKKVGHNQEFDFVTLVVCEKSIAKENHHSEVLPLCASPKSTFHELV